MKKGLHISFLLAFFAIFVSCGDAKETKNTQSANNSAQAEATSSAMAAVSETTTSPIPQDTVKAEVVIMKFSDYQCPACKYFVPIEEQLKKDFGGRVQIVYKNFPLTMHQFSQIAARAAEAAKKQGKFDEMHELIFTGQEQWSRGNAEAIFTGYANSIGLNMDQFKKDLNSAELQRLIMADKREGRDLGVSSTPTFYINGDLVQNNPPTYPQFRALVVQYLKK